MIGHRSSPWIMPGRNILDLLDNQEPAFHFDEENPRLALSADLTKD